MSQIPDKDSDMMEEALEHKLEAEIDSREAKMEEELELQQSSLSRITSEQTRACYYNVKLLLWVLFRILDDLESSF